MECAELIGIGAIKGIGFSEFGWVGLSGLPRFSGRLRFLASSVMAATKSPPVFTGFVPGGRVPQLRGSGWRGY